MGVWTSKPETLACVICGSEKPFSGFHKKQREGESPHCISCVMRERKHTPPLSDWVLVEGENPKEFGVYVVSTREKVKKNLFKLGKHTGSQRKLFSRYRTYLVDPLVILYQPCVSREEMSGLEKKLLALCEKERVRDGEARVTEWVKLPLPELLLRWSSLLGEGETLPRGK